MIIRNSVVLPEPLGPTRPTFSPGLSWKEASTNRTCLPYCLLTLENEIIAADQALNTAARRRTASCGRCRAPPISPASPPTARRAAPNDGRAVGGDDDRLREVEGVRRQQQRQLRDAPGLHLDGVAAPHQIDAPGRPAVREQLLAVVRAGAGKQVEVRLPSRVSPAIGARTRSMTSQCARLGRSRDRRLPRSASPAADRADGCARTPRTDPSSRATTRCCGRPPAAGGSRRSTPLSCR